jgi:hypothetical protein
MTSGCRIESALTRCVVLLALIGDRWIGSEHHSGTRLHDASDWVRWEIAAALERRIPIVPVLVGGAQLPAASALPVAVRDLLNYNAITLSDDRWDLDVGRLIDAVAAFRSSIDEERPARELPAPPDIRDGVPPERIDRFIGAGDRFFFGKSFRALKGVLAPNERTYEVAQGFIKAPRTAESTGFLAMTDRRVIWTALDLDLSWSAPWGDIARLQFRPPGFFGGDKLTIVIRETSFVLTFSTSGKSERCARLIAGLAPRISEIEFER